jgi:gamma-glutamylputrescine oxidase
MPGAEIEETGWLRVSKSGDDRKMADHADLLAREFGTAAEFWPAERVRTQLRSARYFGGVYLPGAFSINPLNYALGLAAAAEAAGARIFEETPALEIDPAGVRKCVTTPLARVRAGDVVLAGNVQIGGLDPNLANTLVPISTYIITTVPLGDRLRDAIGFRGAVSDTELADNHYRVVDRDRLMWSGRCTLWQGEPRRYARTLAADIARTYPQLGKVAAEYAWTGTFGTAVHRMPQIGELSPGVWLLSGFGGQGINTTAMGAEAVVRAIVDGDQAWRLFLPFNLVWAGGRLGRTVVQASYWYSRTRERIVAWLARQRRGAPLSELESGPLDGSGAETGGAPIPVNAPKPQRKKRRKAKRYAKAGADNAASAGDGG